MMNSRVLVFSVLALSVVARSFDCEKGAEATMETLHSDKRIPNPPHNWPRARLLQLENSWDETNQTAEQKLDRIWNEIEQSVPRPNRYPSITEFTIRLGFLGDDFSRLRLPLTFRPYTNDRKLLHSGGSFGKARFYFSDPEFRSEYTGVFSEPYADAIVSMSGGNPYVGNQSQSFGFGFKFFRTNRIPATILTLNAFLGGGAYWNSFGYMTCNHGSAAEMAGLLPTLLGSASFPNQMGLVDVAAYATDGTPAYPRPRFPYALCFVPNLAIRERIGDPETLDPLASMHRQVELIRAGETLFDIYAIPHPIVLEKPSLLLESTRNGTFSARHVGDVVLMERFRRSQFADSRLFFSHAPFDRDLALRPDWLPYMTVSNMVNEGAAGAYRMLFPFPRPHLQNQISALRSLAGFFIQLFQEIISPQLFFQRPSSSILSHTDGTPIEDEYTGPKSDILIPIRQVPNIAELLAAYILQGGPSTFRLIFNISSPLASDRHDFAIPSFANLLRNVTQGLVNPSGIAIATLLRELAERATGQQIVFQNEWPAAVPADVRAEDPYLEAWNRYRLLMAHMQNSTRSHIGKAVSSPSNLGPTVRDEVTRRFTNLPTLVLASQLPLALLASIRAGNDLGLTSHRSPELSLLELLLERSDHRQGTKSLSFSEDRRSLLSIVQRLGASVAKRLTAAEGQPSSPLDFDRRLVMMHFIRPFVDAVSKQSIADDGLRTTESSNTLLRSLLQSVFQLPKIPIIVKSDY